jgi:fumarate hydratase class I
MDSFKDSIRELIVETSTNLPPDVRRALRKAIAEEVPGSQAALALHAIAVNVDMATARCGPICQDTGMPIFDVKCPVGIARIRWTQNDVPHGWT